jgi:hypothetical protein
VTVTGSSTEGTDFRGATSFTEMASIEFVTIEVADTTVANRFYTAAFGLGTRVRLRASEAPTTGFRGFTLSLLVSQPATVDGLIRTALDAGATSLKPPAKSLLGYGGVVQSSDGRSGRSRPRRRRTPVRPRGRSTRSSSSWELRMWPRASGSTLTAAFPWPRAMAEGMSSSTQVPSR